MFFKPNYVPKERKWSYKIVVPFVVLILILSYFGGTYLLRKNTVDDRFTVCDLNPKKSQNLLVERLPEYEKQGSDVIRDYGLYGETLKIYKNEFDPMKFDKMSTSTLFLTNLCNNSNDKQTYLMSKELDVGIDMGKIANGLYEIEALADIDLVRIYAENPIDDTFYSVMRDGTRKAFHIFADKSIYGELPDGIEAKNYLYLEVYEATDIKKFDVVLDPSGGEYRTSGSMNKGASFDGLSEYDEMYKMAQQVKKKLEARGLKVMISRDDEKGINYDGEKGRFQKGYDQKANYYVHMRFEKSGSKNDKGLLVLYSNFTTNQFAANMVNRLVEETGMQTTPYTDTRNKAGVFQTTKKDNLDYNMFIRETGGKFTGSGILPIYKDSMNFAKDSRQGMHTIDILYGYMSNEKDFKNWNENNEKIADATANGILTHLGIETSGE